MKIAYDIEVYADNDKYKGKTNSPETVVYSVQCAYKTKNSRGSVKTHFHLFRYYKDFFEHLFTLKGKNHTIYSFNGANYENYYLLKYFITEAKYKFTDRAENDGEFSAIINDAKKTLYVELCANGKKFKFIDVRISLSIQSSYASWIKDRLGITLAKDGIDHTKYHSPTTELNEEEIQYIKDDVIPFIDALDTYDKEELKAITFQSYGVKKLVKSSIYQKKNIEKYRYKNFRRIFPELNKEEADFLRFKGIHGGISGTNPIHAGRKVYNAIKMDIHSSYPARHINNLVPKGNGVYAKVGGLVWKHLINSENHCFIARIKYKIGDTVKFPFFVGEIEASDVIKLDTLYISPNKREIKNFYKAYPNGSLEIVEGYFYRLIESPFKKQVLEWYNEKQAGNKKAKLLLNACSYGKFAERSHTHSVRINENMTYYNKMYEEEKRARYEYLPLALCITQQARNQLVETAYEIGFEYIVQYDTDSLVFKLPCNLKNLDHLFGDEIGTWGLEKEYKLFKGLWSKHYMGFGYNVKKNRWDYDGACAGFHIPEYNFELFTKFNNDFVLEQLQSSKSYDFGVYLIPTIKKFNKQNEVDEAVNELDRRYIDLYVKQRQNSLQS